MSLLKLDRILTCSPPYTPWVKKTAWKRHIRPLWVGGAHVGTSRTILNAISLWTALPDETLRGTYGADSLQALQLAADIEPVLKRVSTRYDFYFPTSEGYFDQ